MQLGMPRGIQVLEVRLVHDPRDAPRRREGAYGARRPRDAHVERNDGPRARGIGVPAGADDLPEAGVADGAAGGEGAVGGRVEAAVAEPPGLAVPLVQLSLDRGFRLAGRRRLVGSFADRHRRGRLGRPARRVVFASGGRRRREGKNHVVRLLVVAWCP